MKRMNFLHSRVFFHVGRVALLWFVGACAISARAADAKLYAIDVPTLQIACTNTASALGMPVGLWLTNRFSSLAMNAGGVQGKVTADGRGYAGTSQTGVYPANAMAGKRSFRLKSCLYGYAAVQSQPDYFMGDKVTPPPGDIDWAATSATNAVLFGKRAFVFTQTGAEALYFAN